MHKQLWLIISIVALCVMGCTIDAYDKGEGDYSLMTAQLVEAHVDASKRVDTVLTDNAQLLTLTTPLTARWISKADTTYRAILYYNIADDSHAEAKALHNVAVLRPHTLSASTDSTAADSLIAHPLHLESIWMSKNHKYLNLRLRLLTGVVDSVDVSQGIAVITDTISSTTGHARLLFYHDQRNAPEYYSAVVYASIPMASVDADTLTLTINTYDGEQQHTYCK